jgi:antitoxin component YwqK of YwqJK toxin-antitoxin module
MKKILTLLFVLATLVASAQSFSLTLGDSKYMAAVPKTSSDKTSSELFLMKSSVADGAYTIFYDDAKTKVCQKGFMKGGHRVRSWAYYYENQNPQVEFLYDDAGNIINISKEYYETGNLKAETQYRDGKPNGMSVGFNEKGVKIFQCTFKDGVMDGKAFSFGSDGKPSKTETYSNGKLVELTQHQYRSLK